ncbi:hypothetical protein ACFMPD_12630 [Sedimentitalea sp. HM32M-2]|uniref:hypothetical protein n=1 Tax=Sedimentitalea sp. HM32M-2 TaxID=3351566 RepID=UPI0036264EF4
MDPIGNSIRLIIAVGGFAAKPGLLTGLRSGVSVLDTLKEMAATPPPALSRLANDLTETARIRFKNTPNLPKDAEVLFGQMVEQGLPDAQEIIAANLRAATICEGMLAKLDQVEHTRAPMPTLFRNVTVPALEAVLAEKSFTEDLMPAWMAEVSGTLAHIRNLVQQLQTQSDKTARELGLSHGLVIALARRYAEGSPEDFDSALSGLEHALETVAAEREKVCLPGNVSDAVDAAVTRVDELNEQGQIDAAEAALVAELERQEAAEARLIAKGIAQAVLTRNVAFAVRLELKRLALDGGSFEDLRIVLDTWYVRGRDSGLRFDLEVAIALAKECLRRASCPDQRGTAQNYLGVALLALGERESGAEKLHQAVAAFEDALKEWSRERQPLDWASAQNNLGSALANLQKRESDTARLYDAITAFENALREWTRERVPRDWATAQNNLGNALSSLGDRVFGTEKLYDAVDAYKKALTVFTRKREPQSWAATQNNLGIALRAIGQRESGTYNLQKALAAYDEALKDRTRQQVPLDWAVTQNNVCKAYITFFDKTGDTRHLDRAQVHLDGAREVIEEMQASQYLKAAANLQKELDQRRSTG